MALALSLKILCEKINYFCLYPLYKSKKGYIMQVNREKKTPLAVIPPAG